MLRTIIFFGSLFCLAFLPGLALLALWIRLFELRRLGSDRFGLALFVNICLSIMCVVDYFIIVIVVGQLLGSFDA